MSVVLTRYVARGKLTGAFAAEGAETGMGKAITSVEDLSRAKLCTSPMGIMTWMGGHYRNYDAVKVTVAYELLEPEPFPSEDEAWPE